MMRLASLASLVVLVAACDVASVPTAVNTIAQNQCASDSDCSGGVCGDKQQCRARSSPLQTVLFEVTPPADGSAIAGAQFLKRVDNVEATSDAALDLDLVSQVSGEVKFVGPKCAQFDDNGKVLAGASDQSVPVIVSLIPKTRSLGLYSPRSVVQSALVNSSYWGFSLNVPPGQYDIYVEPKHQPEGSCPVPPQLVRDQEIKGGTSPLTISLPEPTVFELHVAWPLADGALNGWLVDMLDPVTGLTISNRVPLALSPGSKTQYSAQVSYFPVVVQVPTADRANELVRLSPPDDRSAPSVLLARSALGLFSPNSGTLTELTMLPAPVHVQGQVTAQTTPTPVASTVTLVATKIAGIDPGVLASFVRTATVAADGRFEVDLLPGTYNVSAVPRAQLDAESTGVPDSKLAAVTQEWVVAGAPATQAGKVVELGQALPINGQALDPSGRALATAQVGAVASPASINTDVLHEALGEAAFVPRASSSVVGGSGDFAFNADPGTFDVSVRPNASTGYGWLVLPSVPVGASTAGLSLDQVAVPFPVSYRGTVTVPGADARRSRTVPGALIRFYIYVHRGDYTADPSNADAVLQIGETRSDENGEFEALIPASLNRDYTVAP